MIVNIKTEFIKLDQMLKFCGEAESGSDAKEKISSGEVEVNGETELRRGRKLYKGDIIKVSEKEFEIG